MALAGAALAATLFWALNTIMGEVGKTGIKNESQLVMTKCDSFLIPV